MPLTGRKILDFTQVLAGPFCTQLLCDMGAEVIKVEAPSSGDRSRHLGSGTNGVSVGFMNLNRGKKGVAVDLKHPLGKKLALELLAECDVLVENFKPGAMDRLGLGYRALKDKFPRLVYCSISGFGQTGPRREDPAFDQIIQGFSGFMSVTGSEASGPFRVGPPIADLVAGTFASQGVLLALLEREKSGRGQWVDISLLDSILPLLGFYAWEFFQTGEVSARFGNDHPILAPSGTFEASDGYINIALTGEPLWQRFCRALGAEEWMTDPRFATNDQRLENREAIVELVNQRIRQKTKAEWMAFFGEAGIPCGPIFDLKETFSDPQVVARKMVRSVNHPRAGAFRVLANPVRLDRTPAGCGPAAPDLGEHTDAVLSALGYDERQIAQLRKDQVVA